MGTTHKKFPVKNFPSNWTKPGSDSVSKDSVKKHVSVFCLCQMKAGKGFALK